MENSKISLNQLCSLAKILQTTDNIKKHFETDNAIDLLHDVTENQYLYILALLFNKKYFELNKLLKQFGFTEVKKIIWKTK